MIQVAGKNEGCPEQFESCFTLESNYLLRVYLQRLRDWQEEAWARCGPIVGDGK